MTSSADPRRAPSTPTGARKRVAGARRRVSATGTTTVLERPATEAALAAPDAATADEETAAATVVRPQAADQDVERKPLEQSAREEPSSEDETAADDAARTRRASRLWVPVVAVVVALGLLAAVLVYSLRPVVSDADRTAAVSSARTTLESLLSYSGSTFDKHVAEVLPELTSPFKDQFSKVAATDIKPMAVKNEATVQAKVYEAGVMGSSGDGGEGTTVRVMAFVNQATTTKAQPAPAIDQNRVIVTMRKTGDRWLISDLSAY